MSFDEAPNDALRSGMAVSAQPFSTETAAMGEPRVNLDRALRIGDDLEDDERTWRMG